MRQRGVQGQVWLSHLKTVCLRRTPGHPPTPLLTNGDWPRLIFRKFDGHCVDAWVSGDIRDGLVQTLCNDLAFLGAATSPHSRQNPSLFSSPLLKSVYVISLAAGGPKSGESVESLLVSVLKRSLVPDFLFNRRDSWGDWSRDKLLAVLRYSDDRTAGPVLQKEPPAGGVSGGVGRSKWWPSDAMDSAQAAAAIRYMYTLTANVASSCALGTDIIL